MSKEKKAKVDDGGKTHISKINKRVARKINTAKFETLEVYVDIEEEIEWKTIEERSVKTEQITKLVLMDFKNTLKQVITELKLEKKNALLTSPPKNGFSHNNCDGISKAEDSDKIDKDLVEMFE